MSLNFEFTSEVEIIISFGLMILIWIIQILHYPSFLFIDKASFTEFENFHTKRISLIVIPLMLAELVLLIYDFRWILFFILAGIWLSTFLIQVPCHNKLKQGKNLEIIHRLIFSNWIRTLLWTVKFLVIIYYYANEN
jgi:hypothetical protein